MAYAKQAMCQPSDATKEIRDPSGRSYGSSASSSSDLYSPEAFKPSIDVAPSILTTRRGGFPVSPRKASASVSECVTIQMRAVPAARAINRASGREQRGMEARLGLVEGNQRRQAVAHEGAEQAQVFQRAVGQLVRPERPRQIRKLEIEAAPASLLAGAKLGARECIVDRARKVGGVLTDHEQRRQNGRQIAAVG